MTTPLPGDGDLDRRALLALTPAEYLKDGYCDGAGRPRPELRGALATAAATQLEQAEASPREVAAAFEALRQILPLHEAQGPAPARAHAAAEEALDTAAAVVGAEINPGLARWLRACAGAVATERDLDALLEHFQAVSRQHAVITALGNG